ncbi:MAG: RNA polymerase sigma factor [Planctomycetota bacterium]|jgi:RNA polymerase sigma-70 factor (ECF subfamily)
MDLSDNDLIARIRGGDAAAFEQLVQRWDRQVYGLAYRVTGDAEEASDVRQMAFLRTYSALGSFNGRAAFSTWLYRVVLNLCRDRLRSRQVRVRHAEAISARQDKAGGEAPSCEGEHEQQELIRQVADAVGSLPEVEREVVVLRHYQGLTFGQIAEVLAAPVSTVKSRMSRALASLRGRLKDVDG